jgi:hypothetical protein
MRRAPFPLLVVAATLTLLTSCGKAPTPADAAKTFFDQVAAGQAAEAYANSAFSFRAQQSETFFTSTLKELGLTSIVSAKYGAPEMEDARTAKVRADFTTQDGKTVPLVVTLSHEDGTWRVFALKSPRDLRTGLVENRFSVVGRLPDFVDAVDRQPAPDEAAVKALVLDALLRFNAAVQEKSFLEFFEKTSLAWQDQLVTGEVLPGTPRTMRKALTEVQKEIGASKLQRAFQPFIDQQINLAAIKDIEPKFDGPARVTTDGLLVVSGEFPSKPYRVLFHLKFMYELPKWKVFGLDVTMRP